MAGRGGKVDFFVSSSSSTDPAAIAVAVTASEQRVSDGAPAHSVSSTAPGVNSTRPSPVMPEPAALTPKVIPAAGVFSSSGVFSSFGAATRDHPVSVANSALIDLWAPPAARLSSIMLSDAGPAELAVAPTAKRKRGVTWGTETRTAFHRIQSFGTIPEGGLGLAMDNAPACGTPHCKGCTGCQAILAEPSGGTGRVYPQHARSGENLERVGADRRRALLTENEVDIDADEVVQTARLSSLQARHEGIFCGCKGTSCEQNGDNCSCGASGVPCWYEPGRGGCGCKCLKTKCRNPAGLYRYNARTVNKARTRTLEERYNDAPAS